MHNRCSRVLKQDSTVYKQNSIRKASSVLSCLRQAASQFSIEWRSSYQIGRETLEADRSYDAVIIDYDMGCNCGIDLIREAVAQQYPAPILLLTGRGTYEVDVEAMEAGAADYLNKGEMSPAFLESAIRYAIERKKQEQALRESEERYRTLFTSMLKMGLPYTKLF